MTSYILLKYYELCSQCPQALSLSSRLPPSLSSSPLSHPVSLLLPQNLSLSLSLVLP